MKNPFLQRGVTIAAGGALLLLGGPLLGSAAAAAPIEQSTAPSPGSTVKETRPTITATFDVPLDQSSTLTLAVASSEATVTCPVTVASKTISCTPTVDLDDAIQYSYVVHAVNAATQASADPDPVAFTVDIPSIYSSTPAEGGLLGDNAPGHSAQISVSYDEGIYHNAVAHLFEVDGAGHRGAEVPLTAPAYSGGSTTPLLATPDSIVSVTPTTTLSTTALELDLRVDGVFVDSSGLTQGTDNPASYAHDVLHFTVPAPAVAPVVSDPAEFISTANQAAVPFAGTAGPGETVSVAIGDGSSSVVSPGVVVAACGGDACPWSLTVDASSLANGSYGWVATAANPNGTASTASSPIVKDTTAPAVPSVATAVLSGNTLSVTVTDTDADAASYSVTVTDTAATPATVTEAGIPAEADPAHTGSASIDVSALVDGALSVTATAADDPYGNVSGVSEARTAAKESVATAPAFAGSFFTVAGQDQPFTGTDGHGQQVQSPTSVTLMFNEPITEHVDEVTYTDTDPTGTIDCPPAGLTCTENRTPLYTSGLQVHDGSNQNVPGTVTLTNDDRGLLFTPTSLLGDGNYRIVDVVAVAAANCPDRTPDNQSGYSCDHYDSTQPLDGQPGDPVVTFTVDNVPPAKPSVKMDSLIDAAHARTVTIHGTAEPKSAVSLTIRSSRGGPTLLAHQGKPITVASDGRWSTVEDLFSLRDGKLVVSAVAQDRAGNASPAGSPTPTPVLRAHVSTLTEHVDDRVIVAGHGVLLSGRLVDTATGTPIRNATITVRSRSDDGTFSAPRTATTNRYGRWHLRDEPQHNVRYFAGYAGSTSPGQLHDASRTHDAETGVKVAIRFTRPDNRSHVGRQAVLRGTVTPDKHGRYVRLYRVSSSGKTYLGRARLDRQSHWAYTLAIPVNGITVIASIDDTKGNLGNHTRQLTLFR